MEKAPPCAGKAWLDAHFEACLASRPPTDPEFAAFYTQGIYYRTPKDFLARVLEGLKAMDRAAELPPDAVEWLEIYITGLQGDTNAQHFHVLGKELHGLIRGLYGTEGVGVPTGHPLLIAAKHGSLEQMKAAAKWCGPLNASKKNALRMAIRFVGLCEEVTPLDKLGWLLDQVEAVDADLLRDLEDYEGDPAVEETLSAFFRAKVSSEQARALLAEAKERPWEPPEGEYSAARTRAVRRAADDFAWAHERLRAIAQQAEKAEE
jgi:hypothetical protein